MAPIAQPTFKPASITINGATTPLITNLSLPVQNTEYSHSLSTYLRQFSIESRNGGTHSMCSGGFNLAMVDKTYKIDGRAPKMLYYSANHTNKLSFYFYHDAGFQHEIQFALEYYK